MSEQHSERVKPLLPLSRTPTEPVAWLWPGRLALTKLAILEGDPGMGKSLVALDLCARITRGSPFPDGSAVAAAGNVLILNGEDGPADTVRPRLETFGADLDRVYVRGLRGDDGEPLLYLPAKIDAFAQYLAQVQPRLVVIDPIMSFLDQSISASIDHSVRRALEPLGDLAAKHQCAMLLLRHLNKQVNESAIYRGAWSMGFVACCRSAWVIAADPENEERHVLAQVKNNMASPQPSLVFTLEGERPGAPRLTWLGATQRRAGELLSGRRPRPRELARELLENFLLDGPRTAKQVWKFAKVSKIAERTLRRAKEDLQVKVARAVFGARAACYWLLPGQELPDKAPVQVQEHELTPWLNALREKYQAKPEGSEGKPA